VIDKLCHACLVDGARMSGAKIRVFRHNDMASLERLLQWSRQNMQSRSLAEQGKIGVLGESVYSMDGDVAPLKSMAALKERYGAWLMIDEAHATGVFGRKGEGLIHALGLSGRIEIQMGTLGKALGCSGGFVAGTRQLVDLLINKARSFIFSTAPSPSVSAASLAAVEIIQSEEGSLMREQLFRNIQCFWGGIPDAWKNRTTEGGNLQGLKCALAPETPILSWHVGDAQTALTLSKELLACGFFVPAIRYPTVPRGTARLRITLSAAHTEAMIESLMIGLLACHEKLIVGS
jgi:glycine C-acetyltransferase/8-amino-7-oxononanoate synthase